MADCDSGDLCESVGEICSDATYGTCLEQYPSYYYYIVWGCYFLIFVFVCWGIYDSVKFCNGQSSTEAVSVPASNFLENFMMFPYHNVNLKSKRHSILELITIVTCVVSIVIATEIPSCCDNFESCCSWTTLNFGVNIMSWILYSWIILSSFWFHIVRKGVLFTISKPTKKDICCSTLVFIARVATFTFFMIAPSVLFTTDCQWKQC